MTRVGGIGGGTAPSRRAARSPGGFALPRGTDGAAEGPTAPAAGAAGGIPALLALQEHGAASGPAVVADRARRRARRALDELGGLQLDLLRGEGDPARLERLLKLTASAEEVPDPTLRDALAEVTLRVRVELARRRAAFASGR